MRTVSRPFSLFPHQAALLLVSLMTLMHIALAFQVELGGDEAHYALYGMNPDWSYFDHPPLAGWLQILPMALFPTDWGARIVPIGLYILLNFLLYRLTNRLLGACQDTSPDSAASNWPGFWGLVLLNATLMFPLMGFGMLPDNPLIVIVLGIVLTTWALLQTRHPSLKQWALLGLLVGLAALSKYTAVTLVVSLLLVMVVEKRLYWLKEKGLWLAVAIALIVLSPVLYWNAIHEWASFLYQLHHGTHNPEWKPERFLRSQAAQFIVYTPLLFLLGWWSMLYLRHYRMPAIRLLLLFAVPVFTLFAWGSGREESLPHWPALAWLLLIPVAVYWLWSRRRKKAVRFVVGLQLLISVGLSAVMHSLLWSPWIPFPDHKHPLQGELGWKQASQAALALQKHYGNEHKPLPLFVSNWSYASHLTWYARPQPVYVTTAKQTQFEFWFGKAKTGTDGLLVVPHYEEVPPETGSRYRFERCSLVKKLPIRSQHSIIVTYYFYHCHHYRNG